MSSYSSSRSCLAIYQSFINSSSMFSINCICFS
nr:MAG TPA: hypothetical protein [Caudoviricetes sp.]